MSVPADLWTFLALILLSSAHEDRLHWQYSSCVDARLCWKAAMCCYKMTLFKMLSIVKWSNLDLFSKCKNLRNNEWGPRHFNDNPSTTADTHSREAKPQVFRLGWNLWPRELCWTHYWMEVDTGTPVESNLLLQYIQWHVNSGGLRRPGAPKLLNHAWSTLNTDTSTPPATKAPKSQS